MATGRHLHLDCPAGIAGDMVLGALIDAGWPAERLQAVVNDLGLRDVVRVRVEQVTRGPLAACHVAVETSEAQPPHRGLTEIRTLLAESQMNPYAVERATRVFETLAEAEAQVHGTDVDAVHFHEIGALDAVVDIAGFAAAWDDLDLATGSVSALPAGHGWTRSLHGPIPLPAPATLRLLTDAGAPLTTPPPRGDGLEHVTPTGAAIAASLGEFGRPVMRLEALGHGAGTRDPDYPNVLRAWIGHRETRLGQDEVVVIETNIDDMNPEHYEPLLEAVFAAGALDAFLTPTLMKKSRPGQLVTVVAPIQLEAQVAEILLRETTTFGVRRRHQTRFIADREMRTVETAYGAVPVKVKRLAGEVLGVSPEHDACVTVAGRAGVPVMRVYAAAAAAARSLLEALTDHSADLNDTDQNGRELAARTAEG